jgi:hypothetical protein
MLACCEGVNVFGGRCSGSLLTGDDLHAAMAA